MLDDRRPTVQMVRKSVHCVYRVISVASVSMVFIERGGICLYVLVIYLGFSWVYTIVEWIWTDIFGWWTRVVSNHWF